MLSQTRRDESQLPMKSAVDVGTFSSHSVAFERAVFRYGLAVFSVVIALGIKLILLHFNFPYPITTSFLLAVAITFWYAGTGPGILSVHLSFAAFALFVPYQVDYRIASAGVHQSRFECVEVHSNTRSGRHRNWFIKSQAR